MSLKLATAKLATAVFVAVAVTSAPAFACMGPTVIFQDSFQTLDPAWASIFDGTIAASGGQAQVTVPAGEIGGAYYGNKFVDSGDFCVDMVSSDPTTAGGIVFGFTSDGWYQFEAGDNQQAAVTQITDEGQLSPVSWRAAPALKTGANVTNTLRVTWKGTSASTYINGQPFVTFNIPAFQGSKIGLIIDNGGSVPMTYNFSNLKVTNVP
jgi:hypothetical protein